MAKKPTTPAPPAIDKKVIKKGRKHIEKAIGTLERLEVEYVPIDSITPNPYNPNRQDDQTYELLRRSMTEDGFTQPIIVQVNERVIIDGEHRWRAAGDLGYTEIPVVWVNMSEEQRKIATLRHNWARGGDDLDYLGQLMKDLEQLGALDWAQDSLMLSDVEIDRLIEDTDVPELLMDDEFGQAWIPSQLGDDDRDLAQVGSTEGREVDATTYGGVHVTALTREAIKQARDREVALRTAKSQEERELAVKNTNLFRLSLIFGGDEAEMVKRVLGNKQAETLLAMCKKWDKIDGKSKA